MRVLRWIVDRCQGEGAAVETPIGYLPTPEALQLDDLGLDPDSMQQLFEVNSKDWRQEVGEQRDYFQRFGAKLPKGIQHELDSLETRLNAVS